MTANPAEPAQSGRPLDALSTHEYSLATLRDLGWRPGAIIDIGVGTGTAGLYSTWPDVTICLIEPSPASLPYMQQIAARFDDVRIYNVGASDSAGVRTGTKSPKSVTVVFGDAKPKWPTAEFPVMRCDDIVADAALSPPFLYKLDTDVHELEVLKGSAETLAKSELCIIEVNVFNRFRGLARPEQVWQVMHDAGFSFFGVAGLGRAKSGLCRAVDLMFARNDGALFELAFQNSHKAARIIPIGLMV